MYNYNQGGGANPGGGGFNNAGYDYNNNNAGGFQQTNQFQNSTQQPQQQQNQFQNPNQWAAPQQQQQQQQQPMNQQYNQQAQYSQQPQNNGSSFFGAPNQQGQGGFDNLKGMATQGALRAMTGQGLNQDDLIKVVDFGIARLIPGVDYTMQTLRTYYAVDNNYVKRKLQKVLFPFTSKHWSRTVISGGGVSIQK